MILSAKSEHVIGLDIGTASVSMVQLAGQSQDYSAVAAAEIPLAAVPEARQDPAAIIRAIGQCYDALGVKSRYVACALSGPSLAVREFAFPSIPPEEAEQAILLEAELASPLDMSQSVVDYQLANVSGATAVASRGATGVFAVASKALIQETMDLVEAASLNCVLVDVAGLALLNCADGCGICPPDQSVCIVDVGATNTQVAVWDHAKAPCVRDLAYGTDHLIDHLLTDGGLSAQEVEPYFQPGPSPALTQPVAAGLVNACQPLVAEVHSTLRYHMGQCVAGPVGQVHLCGGLAMSEACLEVLTATLSIPVTPWNPYNHIRVDDTIPGASLLRTRGGTLAVATGLAMRTI
jgi:type IV pilus assembly protein PilM